MCTVSGDWGLGCVRGHGTALCRRFDLWLLSLRTLDPLTTTRGYGVREGRGVGQLWLQRRTSIWGPVKRQKRTAPGTLIWAGRRESKLQALGNVQMSRRRAVTRAKPSGEKQGETEEEETMKVGPCGVYRKWIPDAQWKL